MTYDNPYAIQDEVIPRTLRVVSGQLMEPSIHT